MASEIKTRTLMIDKQLEQENQLIEVSGVKYFCGHQKLKAEDCSPVDDGKWYLNQNVGRDLKRELKSERKCCVVR